MVFCLFALATLSWPSIRRNAGDKMPSLENKASDSSVDLKAIPIPRRSIIQQLISISVNITSLVMIVLILVTQGCSFFVYNSIYNIVGVVGSFLITALSSFEPSQENEKQAPPRYSIHHRDPRPHRHVHSRSDWQGGMLVRYLSRNLSRQKILSPVRIQQHSIKVPI